MASNEQIKFSFVGDTSSLRNATKDANKLVTSFKDTTKKAFQALSGLKMGDIFSKAVKESLDYVENLNLFNVAMDESIDLGKQFVDTMQEVYGMDPSNIMRYVGNFYQLTSAVSATKEASEVMSMQLTKTANDLSSLFNVDIETVINNLSSGIRGMSRAVYKYGIDIRAATLQETAATLGITKKVAVMTEADREGLRYITIMKQSQKALGDYAKTLESGANQLKVFKEQITQLARAVGNFFLPALQTVLPYINGFIMAIRTMLTFLLQFTKYKDMDFGQSTGALKEETEALNGVGSAAKDTSKKLKDLTAPFDELNVINEKASSSSGAGLSESDIMNPAIEEAIKKLQVDFENVRMKANDVRDAILKFFGFEEIDGKLKFVKQSFETNLINKFPQWTNTIKAAFENWSGIVEGFKSVFKSVWEVVKQLAVDIKNAIIKMLGGEDADNKLAEKISELPDKLQGIADWINEHKDDIAKFIEKFALFKVGSSLVGGLLGNFTGLNKGIKSSEGTLVKFGKKLASTDEAAEKITGISSLFAAFKGGALDFSKIGALISPLTKVLLIVGAIIGVIVAAMATSEDFRNSFKQTISSLWKILKTLWTDFLKPIFETLGPILKDLWYEAILPILEAVMSVIGGILEIVSKVLPVLLAVLTPIAQFLVTLVAEPIKNIIVVISAVISTVVNVIRYAIQTIAALVRGDWKGAWENFKNIAKSIVVGLYRIIYATINSIWNVIKGFVNSIIGVADRFGKLFGGKGVSYRVTASIPTPTDIQSRLGMASGGVVTQPTRALVGEGKYDEAVIPLGDSPQLDDMLNKFASKVADRPVEVKVQIGDKEWDAFTYKSAKRGADRVGATPLGGKLRV